MDRENTGEENQDKDRELYRITVSKTAERALTSILERVNDGFSGGKVNRTQIANWVLTRFSEALTEVQVREIRTEHFDEVALLEIALKQAKASGKLPPELRTLLQKQMLGGTDEPARKRSLKKELDN